MEHWKWKTMEVEDKQCSRCGPGLNMVSKVRVVEFHHATQTKHTFMCNSLWTNSRHEVL
jgi:ribosomal protein L34E